MTVWSEVDVQRILRVATRDGSYPVYCGRGTSEALAAQWNPAWRQAAVIGDENTAALFGPALLQTLVPLCDDVIQLSFPAGEAHKTRRTKEHLEDALSARGFDRSCCIVGVGGGVALDVAGYVAATYLRGVAHVNVATSLLAQVDASIGGKTGVNTPHGKNLIGAFHQPRAVFLDVAALDSLPAAELANGLAEAVKHAVIADRGLFGELEAWAPGRPAPLSEAHLRRCVEIKADVVAKDELEAGPRRMLNFGHTVAHGIEAASEHAVPHGSAVAIGMVTEARVALKMGLLPDEDAFRLASLLASLGLPTTTDVPFERALPFMRRDKKVRHGALRLSLPRRLGEMDAGDGHWTRPVDAGVLAAAWLGD